MFRTLLILALLAFYIPLGGIVACPVARITRSARILYAMGGFAIRVGLRIAGVRILVEGLQNAPRPGNLVVMVNHASHMDGPVVYVALGIDFRALAKKEIFHVPFLGCAMRLAGMIEVDRGHSVRTAKKGIARAADALRSGASFLVFPEGTRTRTGDLGPFKRGAFSAAIQAGSQILPVIVEGTRIVMPRGAFRIRPATLRVRVLDPVDAGMYSSEDRDRLVAEVRGRMAAAL